MRGMILVGCLLSIHSFMAQVQTRILMEDTKPVETIMTIADLTTVDIMILEVVIQQVETIDIQELPLTWAYALAPIL